MAVGYEAWNARRMEVTRLVSELGGRFGDKGQVEFLDYNDELKFYAALERYDEMQPKLLGHSEDGLAIFGIKTGF